MTAAFMALVLCDCSSSRSDADQRSRAIGPSALRSTLLVAGERHLGHEDDAARMLVGGRVVERVALDLVLGQTCAWSEHNEGERLVHP